MLSASCSTPHPNTNASDDIAQRNLAVGSIRTQVDAEGHGAQRVRRRGQAAGDLHGAQLAPEVGAVVLHDGAHLPDQAPEVHRLPSCSVWICRQEWNLVDGR